jgi:hypothetical protein
MVRRIWRERSTSFGVFGRDTGGSNIPKFHRCLGVCFTSLGKKDNEVGGARPICNTDDDSLIATHLLERNRAFAASKREEVM